MEIIQKKKKKYRPRNDEKFQDFRSLGPKRKRRYDGSLATVPHYLTDDDVNAVRRKIEAYKRLTDRINRLQQKHVNLYLFIVTDDIRFDSPENKIKEMERHHRMDKFYFKRLIDRKMWRTFVSVVPPCYYGDK